MNPAAIEHHLVQVLIQWSVIMVVAWVFGRLGRKLGQPLAVGEIFAGIVLGPSLLGQVWPEGLAALFPSSSQQSLQLLAKLGIILLLVQVGMEFDYGHLRTRSRSVIMVSLLGIVAPMLCGLAVGPWLHREFAPDLPQLGFQIFICIALSISALPIMGRILIEMGLERTAIGAMGISSAAIDDVVGWILLATGTALVKSGFAPLRLLGQVAGVLVFFWVLQKLVGPGLRWVWRRGQVDPERPVLSSSFLVLLLVTLFASCLVAHWLGVFSLFGAFLLGVALHQERGLVKAWREKFSDFVIVAMVPIFFTNTGLRTEVGALSTPWMWVGAAVVLAAATVGKLGGCYWGARLGGQTRREAACVAALMNTRALMGLVAINIALELGLLNRSLFTMLVLMALLTTAMTGPLLRWWLPPELRKSIT